MNRLVEIFNPLQKKEHVGIVAKTIDENGITVDQRIAQGAKLQLTVRPGRAVVIECVDLTPTDPDAVVLSDEVTLRDGGA